MTLRAHILSLLLFAPLTRSLGQVIAPVSTETENQIAVTSWKPNDFRLKLLSKYTANSSEGVTIESSYPKGGMSTGGSGRKFGYRIFFYRVINESPTPVELDLHFPADSFAIADTGGYAAFFVPKDTMTIGKEILYNYGVRGLDTASIKTLMDLNTLRAAVNPDDEFLFYIGVVFFTAHSAKPVGDGGVEVVRAQLYSEDQKLFYKLNQNQPLLIPCGKLRLTK